VTRTGKRAKPTLRDFGDRYHREQVVKNWRDPSDIRRYLDNEIYQYSVT
jgi:hypothetical protein